MFLPLALGPINKVFRTSWRHCKAFPLGCSELFTEACADLMEIKSELKLGTLVSWMTKLLRGMLLISVSNCNVWSFSLCICTNESKKGKHFDLDSFLPGRAKRHFCSWGCVQTSSHPMLLSWSTALHALYGKSWFPVWMEIAQHSAGEGNHWFSPLLGNSTVTE